MDEIFERLDTIEESLKKQNLLQENVKDNSTLPTIKNILEQLHFDQYIENFARAGYSTNEVSFFLLFSSQLLYYSFDFFFFFGFFPPLRRVFAHSNNVFFFE